MSSEQTMPVPGLPARAGPGRAAARCAALLEVVAAFALVHLAYRSFKHFTALGRLEAEARLNFSTGAVMILFTVAVLVLCRRRFSDYGLTLGGWRYNLNVGLVWGVLPIAVGALLLTLGLVHFDARSPPDATRALVVAAGDLAATVLLALMLLRERALLRAPAAVGLLLLVAVLALPALLSLYSDRPPGHAVLTALWLFFGAGFGEEIFFRGYVQSRVNQAFGRPWRILGVDFGPGLLVSALLFGLIHALNRVDYFAGRFDFGWWWLLSTFCAGLFLGCLRERTGSVFPGAVAHGVGDVLAWLPNFLP